MLTTSTAPRTPIAGAPGTPGARDRSWTPILNPIRAFRKTFHVTWIWNRALVVYSDSTIFAKTD